MGTRRLGRRSSRGGRKRTKNRRKRRRRRKSRRGGRHTLDHKNVRLGRGGGRRSHRRMSRSRRGGATIGADGAPTIVGPAAAQGTISSDGSAVGGNLATGSQSGGGRRRRGGHPCDHGPANFKPLR